MRLRLTCAIGLLLVVTQVQAQEKGGKKPELKSLKQKVSYSIGQNLGETFMQQGVEVDTDAFMAGLRDALAGKRLLTQQESEEAMRQFQTETVARLKERQKTEGEKNKKEGDAFLAANKKKAGVKALPSGLQYKVLKQGTGPKPGADDVVSTNYRGTLLNGKEFDSSEKHGKPGTFAVGRVIPGWTEALKLMNVGSKWQLYVPSDLAYGEEGAGRAIGPNATLVFDIELLRIEKPEQLYNKKPNAEELEQ